jgi:hypothetical protein
MTIEVSAVPKEYAERVWPEIETFAGRAAKYSYGRYAAEDVLDLVLHHDYALWIALDGHEIIGFVTTTFANYPHAKYLKIAFLGGKRGKDWKDPILHLLRRWARDNECEGLEASGRPGWVKVFGRDGHTPLWNTFQLPLDDVKDARHAGR